MNEHPEWIKSPVGGTFFRFTHREDGTPVKQVLFPEFRDVPEMVIEEPDVTVSQRRVEA